MSQWTPEEVDKTVAEVAKKSAVDKDFRKLVLSNPSAAVKKISGKDIPEGYKIKVMEADPEYDQTFILPPLFSENLTDEELEQVAGGSYCAAEIAVCNVRGR